MEMEENPTNQPNKQKNAQKSTSVESIPSSNSISEVVFGLLHGNYLDTS